MVALRFAVRDRPRIAHGLVVLRADDPAAGAGGGPLRLTHVELAALLELPCAARAAWDGPGLCDFFAVYAVPAATCRLRSDDPRLYVTSFWCPDAGPGMRWVRAFARRAAAFEREELAPRGLKLLYEHHRTFSLGARSGRGRGKPEQTRAKA